MVGLTALRLTFQQIAAPLLSVRWRLFSSLQRAISSWLPLNSTGGTSRPRYSRGRVYWAHSSNRAAARKGIAPAAVFVSQHARHQPDHRVDDHHGGDFAPVEHVVADRNFLRLKDEPYPFVKPFVAAAQEEDPLVPGQLLDRRLVEPASLRREHDQVARLGGLGSAPLRRTRRPARPSSPCRARRRRGDRRPYCVVLATNRGCRAGARPPVPPRSPASTGFGPGIPGKSRETGSKRRIACGDHPAHSVAAGFAAARLGACRFDG